MTVGYVGLLMMLAGMVGAGVLIRRANRREDALRRAILEYMDECEPQGNGMSTSTHDALMLLVSAALWVRR